MKGYIDIHCHILPGADDGPKTMEDTISMIRLAHEQGISHMIATPHYHQGRYGRPSSELISRLKEVREAVRQAGLPVRLSLGNEIYYNGSVLEKLESRRILTLGKTSYILVEFSPAEDYRHMSDALHGLLLGGYRPVLAHAERYGCLREDIGRVKELVRMGYYIQVNAASIQGDAGFFVKRFTDKLMKEDLIHFAATDAHGTGSRSPKIQGGIRRMEKKYGEDYVRTLFCDNPKKLLENERI